MTSGTRLAHAKINLVLEVGGRRPDGFHEVDTILQELELADRVTVSWGAFEGIRVSGPFAHGTPVDETNLAWRAAAHLAQICHQPLDGLGIALEKSIPAAGGLGGGASDAVATLRLLQEQWGASESHLQDVAALIGSDEAFFLVGGTARATGRGEHVEAVQPLPPHDVVVFIPPSTLEKKTARLFAALDALPVEPFGRAADFQRVAPQAFTASHVYNAFERVADAMFAGLARLRADLAERCEVPVRLAGAGPTLFWIGGTGEGAAIARAAAGVECTIIETRTRVARPTRR